MFYDMGRDQALCPKCKRNLSPEAELEFIKKKKRAEVRLKDDKPETDLEDAIESADASESEMFFDMESEEGIKGPGGRFDDEEY
jgi:hypothetical protein